LVVNVQIGVDDLAGEEAEDAAAIERTTGEDVEVRPVLNRVDALAACEPLAAVGSEDAVRLPVGDDEALLARKVLGELGSADAGDTAELVVRRADARGVDQLRRVSQDAGARPLPLVRQRLRHRDLTRPGMPRPQPDSRLDTPLACGSLKKWTI
jgi:hypothetical protein